MGYTNREIRAALTYTHGYNIGLTQVKRVLKELGLRRRLNKGDESDIQDVVEAIAVELEGSGSCLGYRSMWNRLKRDRVTCKT